MKLKITLVLLALALSAIAFGDCYETVRCKSDGEVMTKVSCTDGEYKDIKGHWVRFSDCTFEHTTASGRIHSQVVRCLSEKYALPEAPGIYPPSSPN